MRLHLSILALCIVFMIFLSWNATASSAWDLNNYDYRKSVTIGNLTGAGSNYSVFITLHYGSGTDSGSDIYLNRVCRSDFGDIVIADANTTVVLSNKSGILAGLGTGFRESVVTGDRAKIWFKNPQDMNETNTTLYIYCGNPFAAWSENASTAFMRAIESGVTLAMPMDEGSGTNIMDYSGNGNNGTLSGGYSWNLTGGKFGQPAISFDGINGKIYIPADETLNTESATVITYFKILDSVTENSFISKGSSDFSVFDYWIYSAPRSGKQILGAQIGYDSLGGSSTYQATTSSFVTAVSSMNSSHDGFGIYNGTRYLGGYSETGATPTGNYPVYIGADQTGNSGFAKAIISGVYILNNIATFSSELTSSALPNNLFFNDFMNYYPTVFSNHLGSIYLRKYVEASPEIVSSGEFETRPTIGWSVFHQNNQHTGALDDGSAIRNPVLLWNLTLGKNNSYASSPALSNGIIYISARNSTSGWLFAINATNGQKLWTVDTGDLSGSTSPVVASGIVYVGSSRGNQQKSELLNATLYAVNATTGEHIWNYTRVGADPYADKQIINYPSVYNGIVFFGSQGDANLNNVALYAMNATDGAHIWNWTSTSNSIIQPVSAPIVDEKGIIHFTADTGSYVRLYNLNASTGEMIWNFTFRNVFSYSYLTSSPAIVDDILYVGVEGSNNTLFAFNATSGINVWNYTTGGGIVASPVVKDGVIFIGSKEGQEYALNATTGSKIWNYSTGAVWSTCVVSGGIVYFGANENFYALNATNGNKMWNYTINGTNVWLQSSPAVSNNFVYFASHGYNEDSAIYALYDSGIDNIQPSSMASGVTSEIAGMMSEFYLHATDNINLKNATLMTNNNGTFVAHTTINFTQGQTSGWANYSMLLNSTPEVTINWLWVVYDASENFAVLPSGVGGSFVTTDGSVPIISNQNYNTTTIGSTVMFSAYAKSGVTGSTLSTWTFSTNSTGQWNSYSGNFETDPEWIHVTTNLTDQISFVNYEWNISDSIGNSYSTGMLSFNTTQIPLNLTEIYNNIQRNYYAYLNGWDLYGSNPDWLLEYVNNSQRPLKSILSNHGWNSSHIMVDSTGTLANLSNFISSSGMDENSTLFVYIASHGSPSGWFLNSISYGELQSVLEAGPQNRSAVFIGSCYSGIALNYFNSSKINVLTSTDANHVSAGAGLDWDVYLGGSSYFVGVVDIDNNGVITDEEVYNATITEPKPLFSPNTGNSIILTIMDSIKPSIGTVSSNTSIAGEPVEYSTTLSDNVLINSYMWSSNSTGQMQSSPWLEFDGNPIVINTILNDTIGAANVITVYAKDAFNNTNSSTTFFTSYDGNSSYSETSTNTSSSGSTANFRMKWSSGNGLSGYIFSLDNCAGTFTNYTWTALSGNMNWTNVTNSINSNVGCTVRWKIFVNDSTGVWSSSDILSFITTGSDGAVCSSTTTSYTPCTGGYCVHGRCRSMPTYAGDGFCDSGEYGIDCYSSTVSNSFSLGSLLAGETVKLKIVSGPISAINITTENAVSSMVISVSNIDLPNLVQSAPVKVYTYMQINTSASGQSISSAEISFEVNKSWLSSNSIGAGNVSLYRLVNGTWNELLTTLISEDSSKAYYIAHTPGFSYFAIGEKTVPSTEVWICTEWSECNNGTQERTCTCSMECTDQIKPVEQRFCASEDNSVRYAITGALVGITLSLFMIPRLRHAKKHSRR